MNRFPGMIKIVEEMCFLKYLRNSEKLNFYIYEYSNRNPDSCGDLEEF